MFGLRDNAMGLLLGDVPCLPRRLEAEQRCPVIGCLRPTAVTYSFEERVCLGPQAANTLGDIQHGEARRRNGAELWGT